MTTIMHISDSEFLFVIPLALAIAFMMWVFWNLTGQIKRSRRRRRKSRIGPIL